MRGRQREEVTPREDNATPGLTTKRNLRILFFSDNFPPEINAPATRTFEHCSNWAAAGCRITVITCAPNFPRGRVYEGYRNRLWQREKISNIDVIRVWSFMAPNTGTIRRIIDYISYMISAAIASLFVAKPDVIVATSPQFFTLGAGWFASFIHRRPWVFELRDIWPESIEAVAAMRRSLLLRVLEGLERFFYRSADRIVAVASAFRTKLVARGVDGGKIDIVTNGVLLDHFKPDTSEGERKRAELGLQGKFLIGYIGTHGLAHALETVLDAAAEARRHPDLADVHFLFVGDGARKEELVQTAAGASNVTFLPPVGKQELSALYNALDGAIAHLRKTELLTGIIPSKIFEYMASGVPVLIGVYGEARDLVVNGGAGLAFEPESSMDLVRVIRAIRDPQTHRALSSGGVATASLYSRPVLAGRMLDILEQVAGGVRA